MVPGWGASLIRSDSFQGGIPSENGTPGERNSEQEVEESSDKLGGYGKKGAIVLDNELEKRALRASQS